MADETNTPGSESAPGSASTPAPDTLQDALRALSLRAMANALEVTHRLKSLHDQFDGTSLLGGAGSDVSDKPRRMPGELLYEAARLHLKFADELLTMGQSHADFWLEQAQRAGLGLLPREQRPPVRITATHRDDGTWAWKVYVFNAAHSARTVALRGRWRGAPENIACDLRVADGVVAPRSQRDVLVEHPSSGYLDSTGEHVADVEVWMPGSGTSPDGTLVGRLELVTRSA